MTAWNLTKSALFYLAVAAIVLFSVFPFYYAIITSFATGADLFRVQYWPHSLTWTNYNAVLTEGDFPRNLLN